MRFEKLSQEEPQETKGPTEQRGSLLDAILAKFGVGKRSEGQKVELTNEIVPVEPGIVKVTFEGTVNGNPIRMARLCEDSIRTRYPRPLEGPRGEVECFIGDKGGSADQQLNSYEAGRFWDSFVPRRYKSDSTLREEALKRLSASEQKGA